MLRKRQLLKFIEPVNHVLSLARPPHMERMDGWMIKI